METGVYAFAYRTYNPVSMRWMTQDSVRDGMNWYQYVSGDPVNLWDPLGLCDESGLYPESEEYPGFLLTMGVSNAQNDVNYEGLGGDKVWVTVKKVRQEVRTAGAVVVGVATGTVVGGVVAGSLINNPIWETPVIE